MLNTTHDGADNLISPALTLKQRLRLGDEGIKRRLFAQTSNIVGALLMRIGVLQSLGELLISNLAKILSPEWTHLIVQILHQTNQITSDLDTLNLSINSLGSSLDHIVILGDLLLNDILLLLEQERDELVKLLHTEDPRLVRDRR